MEEDNDSLSCCHFDETNEETRKSLHKINKHASKVQGKCTVCRTSRNVWCCLQCYHIGCGRYEKKHALKHAQETQHYVCVNMESPKHLWCYKCDKGIYYVPSSSSSPSSASTSPSATSVSTSSASSISTNGRVSDRGKSQISLAPTKWKRGESILKSTPIWNDSMNGGMCGMQNLGNTCFMNASLQALLHCPAVIYLFTLPELSYVKKYHRVPLVDEFIKLTYQIWEGKHRCLIPRDILRCIMYKFPQFRGYGQHDAHEFLSCLLQFVHEQYKYTIPIPPEKKKEDEDDEDEDNDNDVDVDEDEDNNEDKKNNHKKYNETSVIYDLFSGEIISQVECCKCKTKSRKVDQILDIQVEIPKQEQMDRAVKERNAKPLPTKGWMQSVFTFVGLQSQSIPLSLCLHSYCTSEDLQNTEKYHCDKCKSKQDAKKTLLISKLPEILMIQIKRFSHDSFWRGSSKVSTHVSFPINALDLKEYIHPKHIHDKCNRDTIYDLCSIVRHMGSTNGGHYISFAKHVASAKWYKFDDSRVEPISPEKLAEQQAYILFYTRRKQDRSAINSIASTLSVSKQLHQHQQQQQPQPQQQQKQVLLSRYWLHRVQAFSRPGPIDNLWLSCYHGQPLSKNHDRRKYCSIKIPYNTWLELTKKYGLQYNAKMLVFDDVDSNDDNNDNHDNDGDIVMVEKKENDETEIDKMKDSLLKQPKHLQNPNYQAPWELYEKSLECDECKLEELHKRREYEKAEIRRLEEDGCPQDCALNMKWANQWRNFVHNKTNIIPKMIDNRHIHDTNHSLKSELIKDTDYLMIPSNIWTFLIEIYGGGPKIVPIKKHNNHHRPYSHHHHNKSTPKQPPTKHAPKHPAKQQVSPTSD